MRSNLGRGAAAMIVLALLVSAGCKKTGTSEPKPKPAVKISLDDDQPPAKAADRQGKAAAKTAEPAAPPPPAPAAVPKVALIEQQLEKCKVKVADALPADGDLQGAEGKPLASLYGKKATVALFWDSKNPYAVQALADLALDVAKPYGAKGVAVVAVNVGEPAEQVRKIVDEKVGNDYPTLSDPQGAYFAKLAADKPPRLFLLDSAGKIVWFDVQYSEASRQDLLTAVRALLGEPR